MLSLFTHRRDDANLDREMASHLEMLEASYRQRGMTPDDARLAARRAMGSVALAKDLHRDARSFVWVEDVRRDLRHAIRALRRTPGFTAIAVLTLALGSTANTAIFSVVNGVLLRPLPYRDGDRLVVLHQGQGDPVTNDIGFSPMEMDDYRRARSLSDVVEFHNMFFNLLGREEPERLSTGVVSANYFDVLGVQAVHGRTFVAGDDAPGAPAVAVISANRTLRWIGKMPWRLSRPVSASTSARSKRCPRSAAAPASLAMPAGSTRPRRPPGRTSCSARSTNS